MLPIDPTDRHQVLEAQAIPARLLPLGGRRSGASPVVARASTPVPMRTPTAAIHTTGTGAARERRPGRMGQGAIMQPSKAYRGFTARPPPFVRMCSGPMTDAGPSAV